MSYNPHYIDLVLCLNNGKPELYRAPAWTYLQKGDIVYVEGEKKDTREVYRVLTIDTNHEDFDFILCVNGIREIKRVVAKVETHVRVFDYEEE